MLKGGSSFRKRSAAIWLHGYMFALAACASGAAAPRHSSADGTHAKPPAEGVLPVAEASIRAAQLKPTAAEPNNSRQDVSATTTPSDLLAAERAAYDLARPAFQRHCARCHTSDGEKAGRGKALKHFNMDSYPLAGHHANEIGNTVREVLGATGERPSMPRDNPGVVSTEELALILAWAEAFDRTQTVAGKHETDHKHSD